MKTFTVIGVAALLLLTACEQLKNEGTKESVSSTRKVSVVKKSASNSKSQNGEELIYEDEGFSTYSEQKIRGEGVVSIQLDINDRLDIFNEDGSVFGEIVLNEDMTYFTVKMPQKTVARRLIPVFDLAAFDFDAENVEADKDYLIIYVNKEKRKVKKSDVKFTYNSWNDYLTSNEVMLTAGNVLKDASGNAIETPKDQIFTVKEVKGDLINITTNKVCQPDDVQSEAKTGWVKWRSGNDLTISFAVCD